MHSTNVGRLTSLVSPVCLSFILLSIYIFLSSTHCSINPWKYIHYPVMQTSFHPIIHISVSVLCIHESTNTLICAVTFKSFTHILIVPSNCSFIHPSTFSFSRYLFILIPLPTNTSLRVFHPHIFPDRPIPTHISFQSRAQAAYPGTWVRFPALTRGSQPSSFRGIWCPPLYSTITLFLSFINIF